MTLVGLPDAAVKESAERVRAAIKNSGLVMPGNRITINLAPADLHKAGPSYDLPIAIGLLAASEQIPVDPLEGSLIVGELGLDGVVRHIRGVLSIAALARERQFKHLFVPAEDAAEATLIPGVDAVPVSSLADLVNHLHGIAPIASQGGAPPSSEAAVTITDLQETRGQWKLPQRAGTMSLWWGRQARARH